MKKHSSFSTQIFLTNLILVLVTLFITGGLGLYTAITLKQESLDTTISNLSSFVANMDIVEESLSSNTSSTDLKKQLDSIIDSFDLVEVLTVCDVNGTRIYHPNSNQIGKHFVGNDEGKILSTGEPYISIAKGTMGMQRRAFHAVKNKDGQIIGFVISSVLTSDLTKVRNKIIFSFLALLIILIPISFLLSATAMYRLKKILMGYEPETFKQMYKEHNDVIDALEEGIFAINTEGRIILMNQSAKNIFEIPNGESVEQKYLENIFPETRLIQTVKTGITEHDINFIIKGKNIISSRIPIYSNHKIIGAVSIFRNKTEVTKLAEELTGAKYMVDTLRAFNHEFMNKLHVILGLLEMNKLEEAKKYILNTSLVSGQAVSHITRNVPIPTLAALLIGKLIRANELGISFRLKSDSYFKEKETPLPDDCYITLVGNLLENAMDELNSKDYPIKEIELGIYSGKDHTVISCDDTGGGIPEEILISIYDRHTTTKGEGHGMGFAIMKELVDQYEGTFHIDTELGEGSSIEIILPI